MPIRVELPSLRFIAVDQLIGAITSIPQTVWLRPDFWELYLHPDDRNALRLARSKVESRDAPLELVVRLARDATEYVQIRLVCTREDRNTMRGYLTPVSDRSAARSLRHYRDRLIVASETADLYLVEVDTARRMERADPRLAAHLGFEPAELLTQDEWMDRVVPEDRAQLAEHHAAALTTGLPHNVSRLPAVEYRVRCRDDHVVTLRRETHVWHDRTGVPERIIAAIRDVSDTVKPRIARSAAVMATDAMLEAIPGFAAVLDKRGSVVGANDAWRRVVDDVRIASQGTNYVRELKRHKANGMEATAPIIEALERVLSGAMLSVVSDYSWPVHAVTQRWTVVVQRLDRQGGALVIHRPTIGREGAAELSVLGAAADHVVQLAVAGELLSALTHDLAQPLAALRLTLSAALELAGRELPDATEVKASVADALEQERRLSQRLSIVHDLVARRDARIEPVDLSSVAEEVVRIAKTEAIARRVPFQSRLSSDLSPVLGDRRMIRAAMLGLVLDALGALNDAAPARVSLTTRRLDSETVEVAVCRFAGESPPSADWVLAIARIVADVEAAPITVDSDALARSCVHLRWRVLTEKGSTSDHD